MLLEYLDYYSDELYEQFLTDTLLIKNRLERYFDDEYEYEFEVAIKMSLAQSKFTIETAHLEVQLLIARKKLLYLLGFIYVITNHGKIF